MHHFFVHSFSLTAPLRWKIFSFTFRDLTKTTICIFISTLGSVRPLRIQFQENSPTVEELSLNNSEQGEQGFFLPITPRLRTALVPIISDHPRLASLARSQPPAFESRASRSALASCGEIRHPATFSTRTQKSIEAISTPQTKRQLLDISLVHISSWSTMGQTN